jgi:hypothetical protein
MSTDVLGAQGDTAYDKGERETVPDGAGNATRDLAFMTQPLRMQEESMSVLTDDSPTQPRPQAKR